MTKSTILVLTGQLLTEAFWSPVAAAFAGRTVVFADNGSDASITGMAERALAAAPERFDVVAHAMGGFVAFEIMRRAPERVRRLALLSTLAPNDTPAQTKRREGYARLVQEGLFAQVVEERIPILLHEARRGEPALLAAARAMAQETGPERFLRQQEAIMTRRDSRADLAQITVPTLIMCGREDGIVTHAHQSEMESAIPGARMSFVDDCGHLLTLERPDACIEHLGVWLN